VIERSYYTIMKLSDPGRQEPPWIVDKVIHATGVTLIYGEAKGGKSTLAAALAATLGNGESAFLGRKVIAPAKSLGILAGDTGDAGRYHEQLREVSSSDSITLYDVKRPPVRQLWEDIRVDVRTAGHDLLIVDNLTTLSRAGLPILRFRPSTALLGPYRGYWSQSHPLTKKDAEPDDHLWPVTQLSGMPGLVSL